MQRRVKTPRRRVIASVMSPLGHGAGSSDRPIAIVDFQAEVLPCKVGLNLFERFGCFAPQYAFGCTVAGKRMAGEIVAGCVSNVLGDARINVAQINEARCKHVAGTRGRDGKKNNEQ